MTDCPTCKSSKSLPVPLGDVAQRLRQIEQEAVQLLEGITPQLQNELSEGEFQLLGSRVSNIIVPLIQTFMKFLEEIDYDAIRTD